MNSILYINGNNETMNDRKNYKFIAKAKKLQTEEGSKNFYCIVLVDENNLPVWYTGYERYLLISMDSYKADTTMKKRTLNVCEFLNFIMWHTNVNTINTCNINNIRDYLNFIKVDDYGEEMSFERWYDKKCDTFNFLGCYFECNNNRMAFNFKDEDLYTKEIIQKNDKVVIEKRYKGLYVDAPKVTGRKKIRTLEHGYVYTLILEALKYDPEIALAIGLQAFAGLREGEIVNITHDRLKIRRGSFNSVIGVEIDVRYPAPYFIDWPKKTSPGKIKRPRIQNVYKDFLGDIISLRERHLNKCNAKGYSTDPGQPLFRNKYGKPLTVYAYTERVKKLFYEHFLPTLKKECVSDPEKWAEHGPYIEIYEDEYPGAHAFRHWFTMYLITKTDLMEAEISHIRGDNDRNTLLTYISVNKEISQAFEECSYSVQRNLLKEKLRG